MKRRVKGNLQRRGLTRAQTIAIVALIIVIVVAVGAVYIATPPPTPPRDIRIGVVAPLTGGAATTGKDMWQAAVLAAEEINAKGGVYVDEYKAKLKIILFKGDTETSPEGGVKAVTKLIVEDKVDVLIGGFSSAITYADEKVAVDHGVPFVVSGASATVITRRTDIDTSYIFHHCPTTEDYPKETLIFVDEVVRPAINERFGFPEDRKLRLAIIYQDSKYGKGVYEGAKKAIEEHGLKIEIVYEATFKMGERDFRAQLTGAKAAKPDVVYPACFLDEQIPLVVQGRRDIGLNVIYLSVECNDDPDYYTGIGRWGEYSIQESRFSPYTFPKGLVGERARNFKDAFKEKWGVEPSMMGASTYDAVYIVAKAIEEAGSLDKVKIRDALATLEMEQISEPMKGGVISFTKGVRESAFELYMEQLFWDPEVGELRPKIVWPDHLKETDFVLPDWYEPGI